MLTPCGHRTIKTHACIVKEIYLSIFDDMCFLADTFIGKTSKGLRVPACSQRGFGPGANYAALGRCCAAVSISASAKILKTCARTICHSRSRGFRAFFARSSHRNARARYSRTFPVMTHRSISPMDPTVRYSNPCTAEMKYIDRYIGLIYLT